MVSMHMNISFTSRKDYCGTAVHVNLLALPGMTGSRAR